MSQIKSLKDENESLHKTIRELEEKNKQVMNENNLLKNYLFSLKEKANDFKIISIDDYKNVSLMHDEFYTKDEIVVKEEKYIKRELKQFDNNSYRHFIGGCEILSNLCHPCIHKIYGFNLGDNESPPFMILQYEPSSLQDKRLDNAQKNRITVELVIGMRYIHHCNLIYRDLKPSNILLSKNSHVRISDFSLAEDVESEEAQTKGIGTIRFMAPEMVNDDDESTKITNKIDVYSFGVTLIFIITGKLPNIPIKDLLRGKLPKIPESVSKWATELITSCLSFDPEKRPSFEQILDILRLNNFDLFTDKKGEELTESQEAMKKVIEDRILKIEAFEFQHQNDFN